jgi:hypothetical protein
MEPVNAFVAALFGAGSIAKPGKTSLPGVQQKIDVNDLAAKMLAFAFMRMREDGALDFEGASRKRLFATVRWLNAQKKSASTTQGGQAAKLFAAVTDGNSVSSAVEKWFGGAVTNPWWAVLSSAFEDAVAAGYLVHDDTQPQSIGEKLKAMFSPEKPPGLVAGKDAEVRAIAEQAATQWKAFQSVQADLVNQLVQDCNGGIAGCEERDTSSASDFMPMDLSS